MTDTTETEATPSPRKIVQASIALDVPNRTSYVLAVCSDGFLWEFLPEDEAWKRFPPIPQEESNG